MSAGRGAADIGSPVASLRHVQPVTLRTATGNDVDAVLDFWRQAAENASRPVDGRTGVKALLERDPDALTLAETDGRIVGTLISGWDGWRCHLYRLAVAPDARGGGVARLLVAAAEERCAALGATRADALVLNSNRQAHPAWEALGYSPQPDWSRWVKALPPVVAG